MTSGIVIFWILGYKYIIQMSIILILTIFSRLITNSHTLSQTIVGVFIGLASTYTQLVFTIYLIMIFTQLIQTNLRTKELGKKHRIL